MDRPTVFIIVYAPDPTTTTFLSYEVASNLSHLMAVDHPSSKKLWLFPQPAWQLSDYATQCQNDPDNTVGALVLYDVEADAGSYNYFFVYTYEHLFAKALFVNCRAFAPPFNSKFPGITTYSQQATYNGTPASPSPLGCLSVPPKMERRSAECTATPTPVLAPPPTRSVAVSESFASPSPLPDASVPYLSSRSTTDSLQPPAQITETETTTVIPTMKVTWLSDEITSRKSAANELSIPFLSIAAVGAYLASRTYTQSTQITQTGPTIAGQPTISVNTQKSGNNSALPFGLGYLGGSLSSLSSLSIGGTNTAPVLKRAASSVASELRNQIRKECVTKSGEPQNQTEDLCKIFDPAQLARGN